MEIREQTISKAWNRVLWKVLHAGQPIFIDDYGNTIELPETLTVMISDPIRDRICPDSGWEGIKLENYYQQCITPSNEFGFSYTYGERLLSYNGINQVENNIDELKIDPASRRAVSCTWKPNGDVQRAAHPPCMIFQQRIIRDGKLNLIVYFRSQDMWGGWPNNLYMLSRWLEDDAKLLGVKPGSLTCVSTNGHIYEHDILTACQLIGEPELWSQIKEMLK